MTSSSDALLAAAREAEELAAALLRQAKLTSTPRYERAHMLKEAERHRRRAQELRARLASKSP